MVELRGNQQWVPDHGFFCVAWRGPFFPDVELLNSGGHRLCVVTEPTSRMALQPPTV